MKVFRFSNKFFSFICLQFLIKELGKLYTKVINNWIINYCLTDFLNFDWFQHYQIERNIKFGKFRNKVGKLYILYQERIKYIRILKVRQINDCENKSHFHETLLYKILFPFLYFPFISFPFLFNIYVFKLRWSNIQNKESSSDFDLYTTSYFQGYQ